MLDTSQGLSQTKEISKLGRHSKLEKMATEFKCTIKTSKRHLLIINPNNSFTITPRGWIKPKVFKKSLINLNLSNYSVNNKNVDNEIEIKCPRCKNIWIATNKDVSDKKCNTCKVELEIINLLSNGKHNLKHIESIREENKNILIFKSNKKTKITVYIYPDKFQIYSFLNGLKEVYLLKDLIAYCKEKELV